MNSIFKVLVIVFIIAACTKEKSMEQMKEYKGPNGILTNVKTLFSDSGLVRIRLSAPKQYDEKSGNQSFPKGIKVEFFEKDGVVSTTLTANSGFYNKSTNIYTAKGNVIVSSTKKKETLKTQLLNWSPAKKEVYTDNFVTIETEDEVLQGTGLVAAQDFSTYTILKPKGTLSVEDEDESENK